MAVQTSKDRMLGWLFVQLPEEGIPQVEGIRVLQKETEPLRHALLNHPIYRSVCDVRSLQVFMASHVFAVWDFMTLLKALQRRFTCVRLPWTHPHSRTAARLINEIVLAEETDEVAPGKVMSHFELYLEAMIDLDIDVEQVRAFVTAIQGGMGVEMAMLEFEVPEGARQFVRSTMTTAFQGSDVEVAASFLLGREDLVPQMFRRLLTEVRAQFEAPSFQLYLNRHIEVDEGEHGPAAARLLAEICEEDPLRWRDATNAAQRAMRARLALWDAVYAQVCPSRPRD